MAMIPETERGQLKRILRKDLKEEITIRFFTKFPSLLTIPGRECPSCPQVLQMLEELTELSPKLHLETYDFYNQIDEVEKYGIERVPSLVLGDNHEGRLKYYGMPSGNQLSTIISTMISLSRHIAPLSMETRKRLRKLSTPVVIQIFVTPSCEYSPELVRLSYGIAQQCKYITTNVIEVEEFPYLGQQYSVRNVPKTIMGDISPLTGLPVIEFVGPASESDFVSRIMEAGAPK